MDGPEVDYWLSILKWVFSIKKARLLDLLETVLWSEGELERWLSGLEYLQLALPEDLSLLLSIQVSGSQLTVTPAAEDATPLALKGTCTQNHEQTHKQTKNK